MKERGMLELWWQGPQEGPVPNAKPGWQVEAEHQWQRFVKGLKRREGTTEHLKGKLC